MSAPSAKPAVEETGPMTRPATDMTDVQLAYVTDMGMLEPTVVSMMSALEGTRSPVAIHLFGHNLTDDAMALLDIAVRGFPQARLHFREVTKDMVAGKEAEDVQYPPTVMAVLHLPRILAGGVDAFCISTGTRSSTATSPISSALISRAATSAP